MTSDELNPPSCPECGESMVVRTARKGRNAGKQFWGCPRYPECEGTRSIDGGDDGGLSEWDDDADRPGPSLEFRQAVSWRDGTLERPGWTCRYTTIGGSLRAIPGDSNVVSSLSQAWIAVSSVRRADNSGPRPFTRVIRKILQRGSAPPVHPESEMALFEGLGWEDRLIPSSLPGDLGMEFSTPPRVPDIQGLNVWSTTQFMPSDRLHYDSEEERAFHTDWVPENLGSTAAQWIIPQASLDTLLRGHGLEAEGGRRVDFLVAAPWGEPFVVEIDGTHHGEAGQIDDDRDALLEEAEIPVVRVPADEVRSGGGPALDSVRQHWTLEPGATDPTTERLLFLPIHVQRLAFAITEGVKRGFLRGDRWVVRVTDDIGDSVSLVRPYLDLFAAVDTLWNADVMPSEVVVGGEGNWTSFRGDRGRYTAVALGQAEPGLENPDLRVRMESRKTANDVLPESSQDTPEVVIRSANVPVRISVSESIGSRRLLPDVPGGEQGDRALVTVLRGVFGKRDFREGQLEAVRQVLAGDDCAVLLPTGAGKSLVYQLAGLCTPGVTLIVDPIVSLMEDQLESLHEYGVDRAVAISAHVVRQGLRQVLFDAVAAGEVLFVYVAPERLQQQEFRQSVRVTAQVSPVNLVVIDEAHCVSEWGHDFRTSYLNLGRILRHVCRDELGEPPAILALTGTASRAILNDMLVELDIDPGIPGTVIKPETFDRSELRFSVSRVAPEEGFPTLRGKLASLPSRFDEDRANFFRARGRDTYSGIVFCPHVNGAHGVIQVAERLTAATGVQAVTYSGGSPRGIRPRSWEFRKRRNARTFRENEAPLLVSTKAFGMGIDKPNIRYVVHYGIPGSIEAYYQEAGRAGRDREPAECILVLMEFDEDRSDRLLSEEASLPEMRQEREEISRSASDDISRQLYFHLNSFPGVQEELSTLEDVLDDLGDLGRQRRQEIPFEEEDDDKEARERALHRLVILGVVRDYLVDWGSRSFDARLDSIDPSGIVNRALQYVQRSQPGRVEAVREALEPVRSVSLRRSIVRTGEELIRFIYETIERSRRRSLREMLLAAREAAGSEADVFRKRILEYLTEGELASRLEDLVDRDDFSFQDWISLYEDVPNAEEARELRGSSARLLSSHPDHPGLLAARAWSEVEIPDGSLDEYYWNLDGSIKSAVERYSTSESEISALLDWLLEQSERRSAPEIATGIAAVLEKHGILMRDVRELEWQALDGAIQEPGLQVLGLARSLDEVNELIDGVVNADSGELR